MEHDGESGKFLHDGIENVECQWRRHELASLRVACALIRSELVCAVAGTDGDSQRVNASTANEVDYFLRLRIVRLGSNDLILNAGEYTQLTFYGYIELMCIFNDFLCQGNVLLVRQRRTVNHYR